LVGGSSGPGFVTMAAVAPFPSPDRRVVTSARGAPAIAGELVRRSLKSIRRNNGKVDPLQIATLADRCLAKLAGGVLDANAVNQGDAAPLIVSRP